MSKMECNYFGKCGSCTLHEMSYEDQLLFKLEQTRSEFGEFFDKEVEIFASKQKHFRARAEFRIYHSDGKISYAMNGRVKGEIVPIDECLIVDRAIYDLMPKLLSRLQDLKVEQRLFGIEFLSSSRGEVTVTLLYHKKVDEQMQSILSRLADELSISIIARSRGERVVFGRDHIVEELIVDGKKYYYKQIEASFTQPNRGVNEQMISWSLKDLKFCDADLLELYCGAGNFTIPFASRFANILATEISKSSIAAAKANLLLNGVHNTQFARLSSEELRSALLRERAFKRLEGVDLAKFNLMTLFVDPPRSGLDPKTLEFASGFSQVIYISCNPATLKRDLEVLCKTHSVVSMAIFDQFAHTNHLEMGVKLLRKAQI